MKLEKNILIVLFTIVLFGCNGGKSNNRFSSGDTSNVSSKYHCSKCYMYLTSKNNNKVYSFSIDDSGNATQTSSLSADNLPVSIVVNESGTNAYVSNLRSISMYSISKINGTLSTLVNSAMESTIDTNSEPGQIAFSGSGDYAYLAYDQSGVMLYAIDHSGVLSYESKIITNVNNLSAIAASSDYAFIGNGQIYSIDNSETGFNYLYNNNLELNQIVLNKAASYIYGVDGKTFYMYRINYSADNIQLTLESSLSLSLSSGLSLSVSSMAISPHGDALYVVDVASCKIVEFGIIESQNVISLNSVIDASISTDDKHTTCPNAIAMHSW